MRMSTVPRHRTFSPRQQRPKLPHAEANEATIEDVTSVGCALPVDGKTTTSARSTVQPTHAIAVHEHISDRMNFDNTPYYLCPRNPLFAKHMYLIMSPTCNLEAFREIAVLMHKSMAISIVHTLWMVYRKSGTGELPSAAVAYRGDRCVWPTEVHSLTKQHVESSADEDGGDACRSVVEHCLNDLSEQQQHYQCELSIKTRGVSGYTRIIEYALEKCVKQGLQSLQLDVDRKIASVRYLYNDILLQRAYLAEQPTEHQRDLFTRLYKLKCDQAMAKHEVRLLNEQWATRNSVHPLQSSPSLHGIRDRHLREALHKEYQAVTGQARHTMMAMYMKCAEEQKQRCQFDYDTAMADTLDRQQELPFDQQLTGKMCELLEKRLANVSARFECEYNFKIELFRLSSDTS